MEPFPTQNIIKQNIYEILSKIDFVDEIIFGKMNYNPKVTSFADAKKFYKDHTNFIIDFCGKNKIKYYIKEKNHIEELLYNNSKQ